jgi:APA family basic amino acid/polyamine antiporter
MATLDRKLNTYGLTMIAVGACIGSGIFAAPGQIVESVPNHLLVIFVWLLGGLIALTGALSLAELGSMFPSSGGVYVYLRKAFGDLAGFLYGWVILLVITTGAIAALGTVFASYMSNFIPMTEQQQIILAIVTIIILTAINVTGVQTSQIFANLFTGIKLVAILGIMLIGFLYYDSSSVSLDYSLASAPDNAIAGIMTALIGVLWSMGGWHHTSYLSGEAMDAQRSVPRAMVIGVLVVTIVYVLVNIAYMNLLSLDAIASTETVAADAVQDFIPHGSKVVALFIAISVFGTIGIYTMSAPRIYYAMAKDGIFFKFLADIHPRFKTPYKAMILQSGWAIILLLVWGTFRDLIKYVVFMDIAFMGLAGISLFILRYKMKDTKRPVKVPLYPIVPLIFVLISFAFVLSTLIEEPKQSIAGLVILGIGVLVYFLFRTKIKKGSE